MELVSVGLPVYNNVDTVLDAVRSIFAQSYPHWELIVVDDGSTDGTIDRLSEIRDSRVRVITSDENLGLPARLNQIALLASGKYLARMDADDLMHPQRLARQLHYLIENPSVDVVGTGMYSIDAKGTPRGVRITDDSLFRPRPMLKYAVFVHSSILASTEWFREHPYNRELRRAQDHELWLREFGSARYAIIPEPLMLVRDAGLATYSKYSRNARTNRRLIAGYGPKLVGYSETAVLIAQTFAKQGLYWVFERFNSLDTLVNRRNSPLTETQFLEATRILEQITATDIPR